MAIVRLRNDTEGRFAGMRRRTGTVVVQTQLNPRGSGEMPPPADREPALSSRLRAKAG